MNTTANVEVYKFPTNKGDIVITFDESKEIKFSIKGPKETIQKVIGGIGGENETEAWATEKHLKTEAQRMYAVLEIIKIMGK